jgi:hypothetical protein
MEGSGKYPYGLLKQPLEKTTIGDLKKFQANAKDSSYGKLWATGRYQIIPSTLKGLQSALQLPDNSIYDERTQDLMAYQLLIERPAIKKYLEKSVDDNQENLQAAALEMAKIWSSIGVPYQVQGRSRTVGQDESYYSGGGDKASVSSNIVQNALKQLRQGGLDLTGRIKRHPYIAIMIGLSLVLGGIAIYQITKK